MVCNVQLSQLLHSISNVSGDLCHLLHRQPCFERLSHSLHQHSLPVVPAEMVRASCQEVYKVAAAVRYAGQDLIANSRCHHTAC